MKKLIILAVAALLAASCGVGNYSVTTGKPDECAISFSSTAKKPYSIVVTVDENDYNVLTVKESDFKSKRDIKAISENTITLKPGTHKVKVVANGTEVYSATLFLSVQEHRLIKL